MASKFPEEIDKLKRVQNFPQSQAGNVKRYNELRTKSNLTSSEQSELQNLTQTLSPYMKTVDDMNLEVDAIENVQKFFKQEVDGYVNAKQSEMQSYADTKKNEVEAEISKFSYKGNYRSDLTYQQRNYVTYNDGTGNNTFIAVKNVPAGIDPSNIEYWHKLGIKGEKGNDGVGLVFKGAWNNTDLYEVGSAVQYGGIIFGCLQNNTGQQPDITKDTEYWAKAWAATVITTKLTGTRTINSKTKSVNFMTGEITVFNPATDTLEVYCNSVALTRNKDYMIGTDNQSIVKIDGEWDGTELPVFFEFRVIRNQLNDLVFSDGQSIAEGTISKDKLTQDIQDDLDSINAHVNNVSNPHNVTTDQIGAVSQTDFATHKAEKATQTILGHVKAGKNVTIQTDGTLDVDVDAILKFNRNPTSDDIDYDTGQLWFNEDTGNIYVLFKIDKDGSAIWRGVNNADLIYPLKIYGVRIDMNNSNPLTSVIYTDDAVNMTPAPVGGASEWDSVYPYSEIKPCLLKAGEVQTYLNSSNLAQKADGTPADITTGDNGDVMVEFPVIYWKIWREGQYLYVKYANYKIDSTWKALAHTKGSTLKDNIYIGAFLGYELNGKLRSLSGKTVTANKTIGDFRLLAQANGGGYSQIPYFAVLMLQILYLIKYKSRDSQTALGRGFVNGNSAGTITGGTNVKGIDFGETTGKQQMKFLNIEDFWGNYYCWLDGLVTDGSYNLLYSNDNFNDTGTGYGKFTTGISASISGYIDDVWGSTETGFIIKSKEGSATTHFCDYGNLSSGKVAYFGGHWGGGSDAGFARLLLSNSASEAYSYIAARLFYA